MSPEPRPLVSVVVTTYNQAPYIGQTLESVLSQRYEPAEVIVVDDGSTDGTRKVVEQYGDRVVPTFQTNRGVAASRNTGVQMAKGDLIAFLDGDDRWDPEMLAVQVRVAQSNPQSGLIVVDGVEVDETGVIRSSLLGRLDDLWDGSDVLSRPFYREFLRGNLIPTTSQVMVPAHVLRDIGPSDTSLAVASDYDLYLRIASRYDVTFIKRPLMSWRYLPTSASGPRERREFRWAEEDLAILKRQLSEGPREDRELVRRELKWRLFRTAQRAYFYGRQHNRSFGRRYLARLLARHPYSLQLLLFLVALSWSPRLTRALRPAVRTLVPERNRDSDR